MRNSALLGRIVAVPVLVGVMAFPAHAQRGAGAPTGAFCALEGTDLLAALDGSWTIHQGPGQALAGMTTVPLPAPPPAPVTFEYNPRKQLIDVQSADLADGMIMFPSAPVQQAAADSLVGKPPGANKSGAVCAWLASPTLIATNLYLAFDDHVIARMQLDKWLQEGPAEGSLDMQMTLVLRFMSPTAGAGMVYFQGKTKKSRFKASAPVTITR